MQWSVLTLCLNRRLSSTRGGPRAQRWLPRSVSPRRPTGHLYEPKAGRGRGKEIFKTHDSTPYRPFKEVWPHLHFHKREFQTPSLCCSGSLLGTSTWRERKKMTFTDKQTQYHLEIIGLFSSTALLLHREKLQRNGIHCFLASHNPPEVDSHTNTITRFNLTFFRAMFMGLRFGFRAGMGIDGQFTEERQVAPKHQK